MFPNRNNEFTKYGIALIDQNKINNTWNGQNTFIQRGGIIKYLDIYNSPDNFFWISQTKFDWNKKNILQNILFDKNKYKNYKNS